MENKKARFLIGLSMKAGKIASGEFAVEKAVKQGTAYLVILAEDASGNTEKKFRNMCSYYRVPLVRFLDKESLGAAIGRDYRACAAVLEEHLAEEIRQRLEEQQQQ